MKITLFNFPFLLISAKSKQKKRSRNLSMNKRNEFSKFYLEESQEYFKNSLPIPLLVSYGAHWNEKKALERLTQSE